MRTAPLAMSANPFADVEAALQRLAQLADELLEADANGDVRSSVERLRCAFAGREQLEPAVAGVLRSVQALALPAAARRQAPADAPEVDRVSSALRLQLLPELRRIGFDV